MNEKMNSENNKKATTKQQEWKCNYCDMVYKSKSKLNTHHIYFHNLRTQVMTDNDFPCNYCEAFYANQNALNSHIRINHASRIMTHNNIVAVSPPSPPHHSQLTPLEKANKLYNIAETITCVNIHTLRVLANELSIDFNILKEIHRNTIIKDREDELERRENKNTHRGKKSIADGKKGYYKNLQYHEI